MSTSVLTYGIIQKRLQIAESFAVKYGIEVIDFEKKGLPCKEKKDSALLMVNLIDAVEEYACVIRDTTAQCDYAVNWIGGSATFTLRITFNFLVGVTNTYLAVGQSSVATAIANIVSQINVANGSVIAFYTGGVFTMYYPTSGTGGNSKTITWSATGGGAPTILSNTGTFSGGTDGNTNDEFDDTDTCLTTAELWSVLNKLCNLQNKPCYTYVNFES